MIVLCPLCSDTDTAFYTSPSVKVQTCSLWRLTLQSLLSSVSQLLTTTVTSATLCTDCCHFAAWFFGCIVPSSHRTGNSYVMVSHVPQCSDVNTHPILDLILSSYCQSAMHLDADMFICYVLSIYHQTWSSDTYYTSTPPIFLFGYWHPHFIRPYIPFLPHRFFH